MTARTSRKWSRAIVATIAGLAAQAPRARAQPTTGPIGPVPGMPAPTPTPPGAPTPPGPATPTPPPDGAPTPPDADAATTDDGGTTPPSSDDDPADDALAHVDVAPVPAMGSTDHAPPQPPMISLPVALTAPTGWLLPAGVIYWRSGVDTAGGASSDLRVGLGDVAEFGVATTNLIRARRDFGVAPESLSPYVTATFRVGVEENRLFAHQPGVVLGFRKSFERSVDNHTSRVAELHLVATERLGDRAAIHAGGVFWDASLADGVTAPALLHDRGVPNQLRAFGGVEVRPLDDAEVLIDVSWVPELCYACGGGNHRIELRPVLSWGVRYDVASWARLESGVTVPDIQDANLLDAQIFGSLTLISWRLHRQVATRR